MLEYKVLVWTADRIAPIPASSAGQALTFPHRRGKGVGKWRGTPFIMLRASGEVAVVRPEMLRRRMVVEG